MRVELFIKRQWIAPVVIALAGVLCARDAHALWHPFKPPSFQTAEQAFEYAQSLEKSGNYKRAMDAYQKVVDDFPSSPLAAEGQFRTAEMLEKLRYFFPAFNAYQAVLDNYPSYPKVNLILNRQFKIGNLFLQGKTVGFLRINPAGSNKRAISIFGKILSNAPFSDIAPRAQYNLGMAYLESKKYVEAAIEFEKIPMRYPHSEFVPQSKYQLGVCAYRQAMAAPYDQEAAQDAINKLRDYAEGFTSDKNVEFAKEMLTELQSRKASSLYQIGKYYEERGSPKAALIYLQEVIKDYPLTRYAEKAKKVASREERKLEASDAVKSSQDQVDEIMRLIYSQKSAIGKIKARGRTQWTFWRYVIPRTLTPDEKMEVSQRQEKIRELYGRLAPASLDLEEKKALMGNRLRMLSAEAAIEKVEDELRTAQVDLQVAQSKLAEIGELPEAESSVMESAAKEIAAKEELVRRREALLQKLRGEMDAIAEQARAGEHRIKEYYGERRAALEQPAEGRGAEGTAGREGLAWLPFRAVPPETPMPAATAAPPSPEAAPAPRTAGRTEPSGDGRWRRLWPFRRAPEKKEGDVLAQCEVLYREADELVELAEKMKLEGRWGESLGAYDHASLKLMELRKLWPDFRTGEVAQRLQKCRGGLKEVTQESARQQYAELSRDLEARIRKNPNDTEAYLSLGVLCQTYGDADGAIKAYKKVLSLQPGDGRAHYNLGIAYMTKRDLAHAAASLKKAADADPRSARAHHSLGVVYKDLGDYEGARRELEQAVAADPAFAPSYFALGQLYQSAFASREKAAAHWERYIHLKPDDPRAPAIREWIAQARLPEKAGYSAGQRDAGKESESRPPRWRTFFPFWRGVPGREGHGAEPTPVARNP